MKDIDTRGILSYFSISTKIITDIKNIMLANLGWEADEEFQVQGLAAL